MFRLLNASEIDARISQANEYYVNILLYKDARCDMRILDETVGPMNWKKSYVRDNANCIVSIWDSEKSQWISKEDTGTESNTEKEKGLASDSFKRACFVWGIGRELYTSPKIAFRTSEIRGAKEVGGKYRCYDTFTVTNIVYNDNREIVSVTIDVSDKNGVYLTRTFTSNRAMTTPSSTATPTSNSTATAAPSRKAIKAPIADEEKILFGPCAGHTFGEVKNTKEFLTFLKALAEGNWPEDDELTTKEALIQCALLERLGMQVFERN